MAYCTIADVQTYLATIILNDESQPTAGNVSQMCIDASENIIDPILERYVTLPVADTVGLAYLKQWSITCVLASIYRALDLVDQSTIYDDKCRVMKEAFENDPGIVSEPTILNSRGEAGTATRPDPVWVKNEDQW